MVIGLLVVASIAIGVETKIDTSLIEPSGLLKDSLLGWQLLYILPVAILTNDFFLVKSSLAEQEPAHCHLTNTQAVQLLAPHLCLQDRP